jgi:threonine dehydratase
MRPPSYDDLLAARRLLAPTPIRHTPVHTSRTLGEAAGVDDLRLKLELFQVTGSFKPRGAYNRIASLTAEERARGVITVSAGNHAQAVAYAAALAGTSSVVVTWKTASQLKLDAAQAYGAETLRLGDTPLEAFEAMFRVRDERGLVLIHPFDDPLVLAGQGTLGLEVVDDVPDVGTIVIPIGGGGLIGGVAIALRHLRPGVRIVGVEPEGAPTLTRALQAGAPVSLDDVSTIADGLSAPFAGALTYELVRDLVDDVVLVSEAEILTAMRLLALRAKVVAEPAAAAGLAALFAGRVAPAPGPVVVVVSGGNVAADTIATAVTSTDALAPAAGLR